MDLIKSPGSYSGFWMDYLRFIMCFGFYGLCTTLGSNVFQAAQMILSLVGSIPFFGEELLTWIRGDYLISGITLNRHFHVVLLPLALIAVVFVHILALHEVGQ